MKTSVLSISLLLLVATMATAQAAPQSHFAATGQNAPASAASNSLRGCLTGAKGNYKLTDHQGKQHRVVGDNHLLWDETGDEVDLTGNRGSPPDRAGFRSRKSRTSRRVAGTSLSTRAISELV